MLNFVFGLALGCFLGVAFEPQVLLVRDWIVVQLKKLRDVLTSVPKDRE